MGKIPLASAQDKSGHSPPPSQSISGYGRLHLKKNGLLKERRIKDSWLLLLFKDQVADLLFAFPRDSKAKELLTPREPSWPQSTRPLSGERCGAYKHALRTSPGFEENWDFVILFLLSGTGARCWGLPGVVHPGGQENQVCRNWSFLQDLTVKLPKLSRPQRKGILNHGAHPSFYNLQPCHTGGF